jgi:hypothetical protein
MQMISLFGSTEASESEPKDRLLKIGMCGKLPDLFSTDFLPMRNEIEWKHEEDSRHPWRIRRCDDMFLFQSVPGSHQADIFRKTFEPRECPGAKGVFGANGI